MMTKEQRSQVPTHINPLLQSLDKKARRFRRDAIYYDYGEPVEFNRVYEVVTSDLFNIKVLKGFQKVLIQLMTDEYHVNSYVQESLVDIYRTVDVVINRLRQPMVHENVSAIAENLFYRLTSFERRLEQSMQRGPVRWGFMKVRSFWHVNKQLWYHPIEIEMAWLVDHMKYADAEA